MCFINSKIMQTLVCYFKSAEKFTITSGMFWASEFMKTVFSIGPAKKSLLSNVICSCDSEPDFMIESSNSTEVQDSQSRNMDLICKGFPPMFFIVTSKLRLEFSNRLISPKSTSVGVTEIRGGSFEHEKKNGRMNRKTNFCIESIL